MQRKQRSTVSDEETAEVRSKRCVDLICIFKKGGENGEDSPINDRLL